MHMLYIHIYIYIYIYTYYNSLHRVVRTNVKYWNTTSVVSLQTVHEHIVADAFCSNKSS